MQELHLRLEFKSRMDHFSVCQVDIDIDKQIHVYGGGNGDDSNFYGVILSVGDGSRMKPVLIWYGGVYTSDSWNQPVTYNHIQFSTKIANVRRALFLCEQPDTFHATLITMVGIKSV